MNHPRLVITPHCAGWTDDCWKVVESEVVARVKEVMDGRRITVKSADPRLQNQEELGCYYPCKTKKKYDFPEMFDFERGSLPSLIDNRIESAILHNSD